LTRFVLPAPTPETPTVAGLSEVVAANRPVDAQHVGETKALHRSSSPAG
jgi:hypothetical protein